MISTKYILTNFLAATLSVFSTPSLRIPYLSMTLTIMADMNPKPQRAAPVNNSNNKRKKK